MLRSDHELHAALESHGQVLSRRDRPDLLPALQRHHRNGGLTLLLPGTYVTTAYVADPAVRARAVSAWNPDAVLTGAIAARLTFWPELRDDLVEAALPRQSRITRPGFRFTERAVPPELVMQWRGLRLTAPALTAIDLAGSLGGEPIDRALLRRVATVASLLEALTATPGRRHNQIRRWLLDDSRDEPWSGAERVAHRLLRDEDITGWTSNLPVWIEGRCYYLDIAFAKLKIAVEIDGRSAHGAAAFESDRERQNALQLAGWLVLRFTWRMLVDEPERVVANVREAIDQRQSLKTQGR